MKIEDLNKMIETNRQRKNQFSKKRKSAQDIINEVSISKQIKNDRY